MLNIHIRQFFGYSPEDFETWLSLQEETVFHIQLDPPSVEENPDLVISWWYLVMAWAGSQLARMGTRFGYNVPAPFFQPFEFTINVRDTGKFANWLYVMMLLFTGGGEKEFHQELLDLFNGSNRYAEEAIWHEEPTAGLLVASDIYKKRDELKNPPGEDGL
jgi:hypothetical protein